MATPSKAGRICRVSPEEFAELRRLVASTEGFELKYDKKGTKVFTKGGADSPIKLVKVQAPFQFPAGVLYDVLHDDQYRSTWDEYMIDTFIHCRLDDTNDICYYSMKMPGPLTNRDVVVRRGWEVSADGREMTIVNSSVHHKDLPLKPKLIRAISILSGFHVVETSATTCSFTYLCQSDPRGKLPKWLVNFAATKSAPKLVTTLAKACKAYPKWKSAHRPDHKPWINPAQHEFPLLPEDQWDAVQAGAEEEELAASKLAEAEDVDEASGVDIEDQDTPEDITVE